MSLSVESLIMPSLALWIVLVADYLVDIMSIIMTESWWASVSGYDADVWLRSFCKNIL